MNITEIYYEKRNNLGDYEHETLSAKASLGDNDNPEKILKGLKAFVESGKIEKEGTEEIDLKKPVEDLAPATEEKPKKKRATRKKKAPTFVAYDRSESIHKNLFSQLLDDIASGWKKDSALLSKARSLSEAMAGKDFLDDKGEILETFKTEVQKGMA